MSIWAYLDPILSKRRAGTIDDPYVYINESHLIINNKILLTEIPDKLNRVQIDGYVEVENKEPNSNGFVVDYTQGIVTFNPTENGKTVNCIYMGTGASFFPASRIWTKTDGYNILETLNNVIQDAKDATFFIDRFIFKGDYDSSTLYYKYNIVNFNNASYLCMTNNESGIQNISPNDDTNWKKIAQGVKYKGNYQIGITYKPYDIVYFNGSSFICLNETNNDPLSDTINWNKLSGYTYQGVYDPNKTYTFGDYVVDNNYNNLYMCVTESSIGIPLTDTTNWSLIITVQTAIDNANNAANYAIIKGNYALTQGDYAKEQGNYALTQGNYAKEQGDYALTQGDYAKEQGDYALTQGDYAKEQGDYTKAEIEQFIHMGEYDSMTIYKPNNIVVYNLSAYINIQECLNIPPTDTNYWRLLSTSAAPVTSVNNKVGVVVLTSQDIGSVESIDTPSIQSGILENRPTYSSLNSIYITTDTYEIYQYNGNEWVLIYNDVVSKKHDHNNKNILDAIEESYTTAEKIKLAGIEEGATADQTPTEIKIAYESNPDTNAFTDAEKAKLETVEEGATATAYPIVQETEPTENLVEGLVWYKPSTFDTKMYLNGAFRAVGGIPPVISITEPTENLQEGLIWFNPYNEEVKIYLDGEFRVAGGSGGSLKAYRNTVIIDTNTSTIKHGIQDFNKNIDILFVFKNSVYLHEGSDYKLSIDGTAIESLKGDWIATVDDITEFNFLVIATIPNPTVFKNVRLQNLTTIETDGTTNIPIGIAEFNKDTDILEVIYEVPLFEGEHYNINTDGQSIDLIDFSLNAGQKIMFYVWKQIRETSNVMDGGLLANNSVKNEKLDNDIKVGSLQTLNTNDKTSITNAINEINNNFAAHLADYAKYALQPVYNVKGFGAKGDGVTDDTAAIQNAVDEAIAKGGGTIYFPPGTYMVTSVDIQHGLVLQGSGMSIIKRPANQPNWTRTFTTQNRKWNSVEDSPPLVIRDLIFDGNRANQGAYENYKLEQAHLLFLVAETTNPGRLTAIVENCIFMECVADAISVYTNADVTVSNCKAVNCFRGGLTVTGGWTKVKVNNFEAYGDVHKTGIDFEVDGAGYGGSYALIAELNNMHLQGDFDLSGDYSYIVGNNIIVDEPPFLINGKEGHIKLSNCVFNVGVLSSTNNRIVLPNDIVFNNCTFRAYDDSDDASDISIAAIHVYWNISGTTYTGQRLEFNNCKFEVDSNVEATDTTYAVYCREDVRDRNNQLIVRGGHISSDFDIGFYMEYGGNWDIRGVVIEAAEPFNWTASQASYSRGCNITLENIEIKSSKYMHIETYDSGNTITHKNVVIDEAANIITTNYGIVGNTYLGRRIILGSVDPTVNSVPGLIGDIYRMKTPTAGGVYEYICTASSPTAATWKALTTVSA